MCWECLLPSRVFSLLELTAWARGLSRIRDVLGALAPLSCVLTVGIDSMGSGLSRTRIRDVLGALAPGTYVVCPLPHCLLPMACDCNIIL